MANLDATIKAARENLPWQLMWGGDSEQTLSLNLSDANRWIASETGDLPCNSGIDRWCLDETGARVGIILRHGVPGVGTVIVGYHRNGVTYVKRMPR